MEIRPIKTEEDYKAALREVSAFFDFIFTLMKDLYVFAKKLADVSYPHGPFGRKINAFTFDWIRHPASLANARSRNPGRSIRKPPCQSHQVKLNFGPKYC